MLVASTLPTKSSPQPDPLPLKVDKQVYNGQVIQKEGLVIAVQKTPLGGMLWPLHLDLSPVPAIAWPEVSADPSVSKDPST